MVAATGVPTTARYIFPFNPNGKNIASVHYQSQLSPKAQNKLKAYEIYKLGKLSMEEIAQIFGVHKTTIARWIQQSQTAKSIRRYQYLEPKTTAPHNRPRKKKITDEIKSKILTIRDKRKCGKNKIAWYLKRDYGIEIHPTTVQRFLNELSPADDPKWQSRNIIKFKKKRKGLIRIKDVVDKLTNRAFGRFQIDSKYWVINGRTFYIVAAVDVISRMMFAYAYTRHTAICAKDFLSKLDYLFNLNGSEAYIQRDNGSEFMAEFENLAGTFGITLITNYAKRPQMNGYVERLNKIIKDECLEYHMPDTVSEANDMLGEYVIDYNFERAHDSLSYSTPFERFCDITFSEFQCDVEITQPLLQMYRASTIFEVSLNGCYNKN